MCLGPSLTGSKNAHTTANRTPESTNSMPVCSIFNLRKFGKLDGCILGFSHNFFF
jgi:hypothetical protein